MPPVWLLSKQSMTKKSFISLAAGPLEDFLVIHGERYISDLRKRALQHGKVRLALGGVWQRSIKKSVWRQIEVLSDRPGKHTSWKFEKPDAPGI
jgi:hypothetical protein